MNILILIAIVVVAFLTLYLDACRVKSRHATHVLRSMKQRRCAFCAQLDYVDNLDRVFKSREYGFDLLHWYHDACYKDVLRNPTRYGHRLVDVACEVDEILTSEFHAEEMRCRQREACLQRARENEEKRDDGRSRTI